MEVSSSVKDLDEITKQVQITIPAGLVTERVEAELKSLAAKTAIKGFRPGKAPRQVVDKLHRGRVIQEVVNDLMIANLSEVISRENMNIVGMPKVEVGSIETDKDITYTVTASIYPEPTVTGYESFDVSVPKHEVAASDVDEVVQRLLKSKSAINKVELRNKAQNDDVIDASVQVSIDGKEPSRPEPLTVGLGEGRLPLELEAGIRGMEIGETKEISVTFNAEHPNQKLSGKTAVYKVTLNKISEKVPPELNDQFVESLGIPEAKTVVELRLNIRKRLEQEQERTGHEMVRQAVLEELLKRNQFKVPPALIEEEIRRMLVRAGIVDPAKIDVRELDVEPYREGLQVTAENRVRTTILVDKIADIEGIKAEENEIEKYVSEVAQGSGMPENDVKRLLLSDEHERSTRLEIVRSKVLDLLEKRAAVRFEENQKEAADQKDAAQKS